MTSRPTAFLQRRRTTRGCSSGGGPTADYKTYEEAKDAIGARNYVSKKTTGVGVGRFYVFYCKVHEQCKTGNGAQMRIIQVVDGEVRSSQWNHSCTCTGFCQALY